MHQACAIGYRNTQDDTVHLYSMREYEKLSKELGLFNGLSDVEQAKLLAFSTRRTLAKGQFLVRAGQLPKHVYVVEKGRICSFFTDHLGHRGMVRIVGANDFFSYLFCFRRKPAIFDYVAQTTAIVREIEIPQFEELAKANKFILLQMNKVLIERLEYAYLSLQETVVQKLTDRVAHLIADLGHRFGEPTSLGLLLEDISHEELASCLGASRAKVSISLQQLRSEGLVLLKRRGLLLILPKALKEYSSSH